MKGVDDDADADGKHGNKARPRSRPGSGDGFEAMSGSGDVMRHDLVRRRHLP